MKKVIIIAALVLTSAVTAFSLTTSTENKIENSKIKEDSITVSVKSVSAPKSDIATAD